MTSNPATDEELLALYVHRRDGAAAAALVERWQTPMYNLALRCLRDESDAADAVQSAFLAALRGAAKFRGESAVRTWLYRTTLNEVRRLLQKKQRSQKMQRDLDEDPAGEPRRAADDDAESRTAALDSALAALPQPMREVLVLHYHRDLSYKELSDVLGVAMGTVASRLAQAREQLKRRLAATGAFGAVLAGSDAGVDAALRTARDRAPSPELSAKLAAAAHAAVPAASFVASGTAAAVAAVVLAGAAAAWYASPRTADGGRVAMIQNPSPAPSAEPEPAAAAQAPARRVPAAEPGKASSVARAVRLRVSGTVIDGATGAPEPNAWIQLDPIWPQDPARVQRKINSPQTPGATSGPDGKYAFEVDVTARSLFRASVRPRVPGAVGQGPNEDPSARFDYRRGADACLLEIDPAAIAEGGSVADFRLRPLGEAESMQSFRRQDALLEHALEAAFAREQVAYISGVVQLEDGSVPQTLQINLVDSKGRYGCEQAYTPIDRATGAFVLGPLTSERWRVEAGAGAAGFAAAGDLDVAPGRAATGIVLTLRAGDAELRGVVRDAKGAPSAKAQIRAYPAEATQNGVYFEPAGLALSDEAGRFVMTKVGMRGAELRLVVTPHDDRLRAAIVDRVIAGTADLGVVLQAKPVVRGRVAESLAAAAASGELTIYVEPIEREARSKSRVPMQTQSLSIGLSVDPKTREFSCRVSSPGAYLVRAAHWSDDYRLERVIEVGEGDFDLGEFGPADVKK